MSTSSPAAAGGSPRRTIGRSGSRSWTVTIILTVAGTAALLLVGYLATMIFGNVLGTEFCPYTLERRGYAFREIPFTGIVELHIIQKGYIVPDTTKSAPDDWHLLSLIRFRGTYAEGDAELLMKYFDAKDDKGNYAWLEWSEANPTLAKILWPAVAKAAQDNNYLIVPDLFSFARSTTNPVELQKTVDATMAKLAGQAGAKPPGEKELPATNPGDKEPVK
jgi:hypothetical protein